MTILQAEHTKNRLQNHTYRRPYEWNWASFFNQNECNEIIKVATYRNNDRHSSNHDHFKLFDCNVCGLFQLVPCTWLVCLVVPTNILFSQFTDVSGTSPELHVSRVELVAKIPNPQLKSEECVGRTKQSLDLQDHWLGSDATTVLPNFNVVCKLKQQ